MKHLMTGNAAAAWGARLAGVDYIPAFPITPQTEIIERLSTWVAEGELDAKFVSMDGEHSMMMAAGAAAATGVRVFTATSSQGLVYAMESLYTIAGWRVPLVLVNVSRGLSAPLTLGPDHNDVLAARDTGFVQIHAETCQEVLDSILMGYRIAESAKVSLPVLVNLDGFYLSFTREPVDAPDADAAAAFVGEFNPTHPPFRATTPMAQGVAVLEGSVYSYFRYQLHEALQQVLNVHDEVADEFAATFGRKYGPVECYKLDDADMVLVMAGSFATKGKAAVERWRAQGKRVGLLRLRLVRPFPSAAIVQALRGKRAVAVFDQNISPGSGGIFFQEIAACLASVPDRPETMRSFIGGLGGKDISMAEFDHMLNSLESGEDQPGAPELLMTKDEWDLVRQRLSIAGKSTTGDSI